MNYMWEVLLQGEEQGLGREDIRFEPSRTANPYREVFFKDFNKPILTGGPIDVNAYYRYASVFGPLLDEGMDNHPELQSALFDILAHFLSELDLRSGLCQAEYYARFLREDIAAGLTGRDNAGRLGQFSRKQARLVAACWLRAHKVGTSMKLFAQLLRALYPNSIAYLDARGVRELLIYVGKIRTPELAAQLELLRDLFVPADYDVKLFWDMHFGLIDTEETMEIGNIMIY
ncbi:MAG: hypothetical protein LBH28_11110 [Oscillospiraceae bacterium]|jgi:hypothetical protein|nr:hypothetical protein [Oscillospiraceae bacterium]